jgi:3-oxoacyl-[acyl-carrier protein] reductase
MSDAETGVVRGAGAPAGIVGQVALVTGASRGIGRAIAMELARHGAIVVGTATTAAGSDDIGAALAAAGARGRGAVLDVTDPQAGDVLVDALGKAFGAPTILVNNAGITRDNLAMRMKDDEWQSVIDTNLSAVFRMSRSVMRGMMKARRGRIVNITSVVGSAGNAGQANYAAAKAGVAGMTRALARELGSRSITVNCIAPGFIDTDMTRALDEDQTAALVRQIPLGRFGQPDDIAAAVAFLCSPQADYITGVTLHVNGGMYME